MIKHLNRNKKTTPEVPKKEANPPPKKIPSFEEMLNMQIEMNIKTQQIDKTTETMEKQRKDLMQKAKAIKA
ncbi:MAG: hypothetical protein Q8S01_10235 [Ignavibacteria bacterium]|nr:hypothetical protein [Ignavibacteria bacterium]